MEVKKKSISLKLNKEIKEPEINLMHLPAEVLTNVASFLSKKQVKSFGLLNKKCQGVYQHTLNKSFIKCVDLRKNFYLNEEKILERVKDLNYRRVNLNQCYNSSPMFILELVSKESIRELNLIGCQCSAEVIAAVAQLNLTLLSICLSSQWRTFFILNEHNSVPFLNGLKKLEIFHWNKSKLLMSHVSRYVLPHCHQLRCLKLFTMPIYVVYIDESDEVFEAPKLIPTQVPELESLILDFHNAEDIFHHINRFLDIILYEKKIPLTNVYLGKQTLTVFLSENLCRENVSYENADTFCFSRPNYLFQRNLPNFKTIQFKKQMFAPLLKSTKYSKIIMENMMLGDLSRIPKVFLRTGNTSIEEVNFNGSEIDKGLSDFITEISSFNSGITFLDISLARWSPATENEEETNVSLIKSIANLTNLRTLYMVPSMLRHTESDKNALKQSFFEVTNKCTSLNDLRIVDKHNIYNSISQDVLALIQFFKNLKKLHLANFTSIGNGAILPKIVENCTKLKYLHVKNIENEMGLEEMLIHAKLFKQLRIDQRFKLTKTFVDNLSQCTQLEKLCISRIDPDAYPEMLRYLAESLKKLNKLQIFSSSQMHLVQNDLRPAMKEIQEKRPSFFFNDFKENIPLAHHEFLRNR